MRPRRSREPPGCATDRRCESTGLSTAAANLWVFLWRAAPFCGRHAERRKTAEKFPDSPCLSAGPGHRNLLRTPSGVPVRQRRRSVRRGNSPRWLGDGAAGTGRKAGSAGSVTGPVNRRALATHTCEGPSPFPDDSSPMPPVRRAAPPCPQPDAVAVEMWIPLWTTMPFLWRK